MVYQLHSLTVIDREALVARVSGHLGLLDELVAMFANESALMLDQMHAAIASGDNTTLESVAHTLKGSAYTLTGYSAAETAGALESLGRNLRAREAKNAYMRLEREITTLNKALEEFTLRKAAELEHAVS